MVESIKIKELDIVDRPREKLRKFGAENLTDKELLAIILRTGTKKMNVISLADKILKDSGGINNLRNVTFNELIKHNGVGEVKAIDILASLELAKRIFTENIDSKIVCNSPEVVANYLRYKLQDLKQELFIVLDINTKGKIIDEREIFKGTLSMAVVHPREVFKNAIKNSAASIICVHNHPSGEAEPSLEDIQNTKKLMECGETLGIDVLDHIIVAKKGYCSLRKFFNIMTDETIDIKNLTPKHLQQIIKKYNLISNY